MLESGSCSFLATTIACENFAMSRCRAILMGAILSLSGAESTLGSDWIFDSGPYTRNPKTGQRVDQFKALPHIDRIPFEKFFSEDGPHPFGMDWWMGDWGMGGYGYGFGEEGFDWGGFGGFGAWGGLPYDVPFSLPFFEL
jgi:hypothetical protein